MHYTYIFSYWVYFYFIAYYYKFIKYTPIILLIITCIYNINSIIFNLKYIFTDYIFLLLLYLNISIHFIPLYYCIKNKKTKEKTKNILLFNIILYISYLLYLYSNNIDINTIYNNMYMSTFNNNTMSYINYFIKTRFINYYDFILVILGTLYMNYKILKT